ncbi:MAG: anaerobic carbon-monoxide dehydrogenase catalytic subunit [Enterobacteriaceae bacterium]
MEIKRLARDPAAQEMIAVANKRQIATVWHRYQAQQPQCGFGSLGVCCRICWKGPCRIDPFGEGPQAGICGATADTIVARNLVRMMAAGAASHSEHGRHIALALCQVGRGELPAYRIRDEHKLRVIAGKLGVSQKGKSVEELALAVGTATLEDYQRQEQRDPHWLPTVLPSRRLEKLRARGLIPHNIDAVIAKTLARTHIGCDADYTNLLSGGMTVALADLNGMALATELSDVLFGTPVPVQSAANLGTLRRQAVNIALNGHNPLLSEIICEVAQAYQQQAIEAGAEEGINIVGVCCTGNEVLMRHGIPLASNYLSQELPILTGVLDAMVLDVQCIMPSLPKISECFHTRVITTMAENRMPGATHIEFDPHNATACAQKIVTTAIAAFRHRDPQKIHLPEAKTQAMAGFSAEAVVAALAAVDAEDPLQVLIDAITRGDIQGLLLFGGCNNAQVRQDENYITIAQEMARRNVLMVVTGCGAGALAKHGYMTAQAVERYAGDSLKATLQAVGKAAGLPEGLPLVLHMGSCVDNSRVMTLGKALADKLGVDLCDLPLVASAPEAMSEKAVVIAAWAVTSGIPTHLGTTPQIMGSAQVTRFVTEECQTLIDGYFLPERDPHKAADKLWRIIQQKRQQLGLSYEQGEL